MKLLMIFFLFTPLAYAGGAKVIISDYMQVHKPFLSLTCINEKTQQEMDQCGERSLVKAKSKMNALLETLKTNHKSAEPALYDTLEASQLTWNKYMEASCKVETYYSRGGSGFSSIWSYCIETKINERISYLSWMMENP
ncbi:MAG: DUF1311 domain-containing protein [Alteromonadales bacterium]|nr:DUF1311 domain-containing protein [Alteromonadales bacterium]